MSADSTALITAVTPASVGALAVHVKMAGYQTLKALNPLRVQWVTNRL
jgi:hypothetical protein